MKQKTKFKTRSHFKSSTRSFIKKNILSRYQPHCRLHGIPIFRVLSVYINDFILFIFYMVAYQQIYTHKTCFLVPLNIPIYTYYNKIYIHHLNNIYDTQIVNFCHVIDKLYSTKKKKIRKSIT